MSAAAIVAPAKNAGTTIASAAGVFDVKKVNDRSFLARGPRRAEGRNPALAPQRPATCEGRCGASCDFIEETRIVP
jgi:hypothetical protein